MAMIDQGVPYVLPSQAKPEVWYCIPLNIETIEVYTHF